MARQLEKPSQAQQIPGLPHGLLCCLVSLCCPFSTVASQAATISNPPPSTLPSRAAGDLISCFPGEIKATSREPLHPCTALTRPSMFLPLSLLEIKGQSLPSPALPPVFPPLLSVDSTLGHPLHSCGHTPLASGICSLPPSPKSPHTPTTDPASQFSPRCGSLQVPYP